MKVCKLRELTLLINKKKQEWFTVKFIRDEKMSNNFSKNKKTTFLYLNLKNIPIELISLWFACPSNTKSEDLWNSNFCKAKTISIRRRKQNDLFIRLITFFNSIIRMFFYIRFLPLFLFIIFMIYHSINGV